MEGFRQQDEINALGDRVPPPRSAFHLPKQLPGRLRDLSPDELDWLELALRGKTLEGALDLSPHNDVRHGPRTPEPRLQGLARNELARAAILPSRIPG